VDKAQLEAALAHGQTSGLRLVASWSSLVRERAIAIVGFNAQILIRDKE